MMKLSVNKIIEKTNVEGPGTRFCIWVQGCTKRCKECWATSTWDKNAGTLYEIEEIFNKILSQKNTIEGVTFLGGEPFEQAKALAYLAKKIKETNLSLVVFTGLTLEELKAKNDTDVDALLSCTDLLIDGGFEVKLFDTSRPWVGSSNQRFIFLTDRYSKTEISKCNNNVVEIRINKDGNLFVNGMGDFNRLRKDLFTSTK